MPPPSTFPPRIYTLLCWQMLRSNRVIGILWGVRRIYGNLSASNALILATCGLDPVLTGTVQAISRRTCGSLLAQILSKCLER